MNREQALRLERSLLLTVGTPFGGWRSCADALLRPAAGGMLLAPELPRWLDHVLAGRAPGGVAQAGLPPPSPPAGDAPWGGADLRACWALDALAAAYPGARYLVFVESPEFALARWLEAEEGDDEPEHWLRDWQAGAQALQRHVQRHDEHCLLVEAGEAAREPAALAQLCAQRLGVVLPQRTDMPNVEPPVSALVHSLALGWLSAQPRLRAIGDELLAGCTPLAAASGLPGPPGAASAVSAWRTMRRDARRAAALAAQCEASSDVVRALEAAVAQARDEMAALRSRGELLLRQLHETQGELESHFKARQDSASRVAALEVEVLRIEELQQRLDALITEAADLRNALDHERAAREGDTARADGARAAMADELARALAHAASLQQRHVDELQQQRDELERTHRQALEARSAAAQEALRQQHDELWHRHLEALGAQVQAAEASARRQHEELASFHRGELDARMHATEAALLRQREELEFAHLEALDTRLREADEERRRQREDLERAHQAALQRLGTELDDSRRVAADACHEGELLLLLNRQLRSDLKQAMDEAAADAAAAHAGLLQGAEDFRVDEIVVGSGRDEPPHRELAFSLHGVRSGAMAFEHLSVRLVEHHGRAGLVVFDELEAGPAGWRHWQASGEEDGRPYMLLVPSDPHAGARMDALSSQEWLLLVSIAAEVEAALSRAAAEQADRWRLVARRLRQELAAWPARWRFDELTLSAAGDGVVGLSFGGVHCGRRRVSALQVGWHVSGVDGAELQLVQPTATADLLALPAGAAGPDGAAQAAWRLALGSAARSDVLREQWQALGSEGRAFIYALLDALPALLALAPPAALPPGATAAGMSMQAARVLDATHRGLAGSRWRAALRVIAGRSPVRP